MMTANISHDKVIRDELLSSAFCSTKLAREWRHEAWVYGLFSHSVSAECQIKILLSYNLLLYSCTIMVSDKPIIVREKACLSELYDEVGLMKLSKSEEASLIDALHNKSKNISTLLARQDPLLDHQQPVEARLLTCQKPSQPKLG